MVLEIVEYRAVPGQGDALFAGLRQALAVIRSAEGCIEAHASQSIEDPDECVVLVVWHRLEDHLETFRNGPLFGEYRQHVNGLFIGQPRVRHYPSDE